MKGIKKTLAIGIIALFIGLAVTPLISGNNIVKVKKADVQKNTIPMEMLFCQTNGEISEKTVELTVDDIDTLEGLFNALQKASTEREFRSILESFLSHFANGKLFCIYEWLEKVVPQGSWIFSYGQGRRLKDLDVKFNSLVKLWTYERGQTAILSLNKWGLKFQVHTGPQIGWMCMFGGVYFHFPAEFSQYGLKRNIFFFGKAACAGCLS